MLTLRKPPPAGLYIHVPFCTSVCPYCDFAVTIAGEDRRAAWGRGVLAEAAMHADQGLEFDTIYFGGGTPSSLDPRSFSQILAGLRERLPVRDDAWIHVEINPEDVTSDNIACWRDLGVRFVSLGVQSFDDSDLEFMGRRHSGACAADAATELLASGFHTVSVDLIYGLPGQTAEGWLAQLERAVTLGVHHLSCYQLTFHEGTVFGRRLERGRISELPEDEQADLFFLTHTTLADAGLPAYEVSNFARDGHRSHHNQKYWNHTPYLGLGPSAHSWVGGVRWWNIAKLRRWQRRVDSGRPPVDGREHPTPAQLALEALMLGLRSSDGVDVRRVRELSGIDLCAENLDTMSAFEAAGHLTGDDEVIRPTLSGMAIADTIARAFVIPSRSDEIELGCVR
jgi:oxygen-independent coproporphyrinogen-3 oxidase